MKLKHKGPLPVARGHAFVVRRGGKHTPATAYTRKGRRASGWKKVE